MSQSRCWMRTLLLLCYFGTASWLSLVLPNTIHAKPPREVARFGSTNFRHVASITSIAYSPDGKLLASSSHDGTVRVWDEESSKERFRFTHSSYVYSASFSPDGNLLAVSGTGRQVFLLDAKTGKELKQLTIRNNKTGSTRRLSDGIRTLAFSPDGKFLASGDENGSVRIWEVATGKQLSVFEGHKATINSVTYSSDGRLVASGSGNWQGRDCSVRIWNATNGKELFAFAHPGMVLSVAFTPDAKSIIASSPTKTIQWHLDDKAENAQQRSRELLSAGGVLSRSGNLLAIGSYRHHAIVVWDLVGNKEATRIRREVGVAAMSFSPKNDDLLAIGGSDKRIDVWSVSRNRAKHSRASQNYCIHSLDFSPDERLIISRGGDFSIWIWDLSKQRTISRFVCPENPKHRPAEGGCDFVRLHPNGKSILATDDQGRASIWDAKTGARIGTLGEFSCSTYCLSANGTAFTSDYGGGIQVWEWKPRKQLKRFVSLKQLEEVYHYKCLAADSANTRLFAVGKDDVIRIFDVEKEKEIQTIPIKQLRIRVLSVTQDGSILAVGGTFGQGHSLQLISGKDKDTITRIKTDDVMTLEFSPNGRILASGHEDGTIRLWNPLKGDKLAEFSGHESSVFALRFSPTGRLLATGGLDTTIAIWNLEPLVNKHQGKIAE